MALELHTDTTLTMKSKGYQLLEVIVLGHEVADVIESLKVDRVPKCDHELPVIVYCGLILPDGLEVVKARLLLVIVYILDVEGLDVFGSDQLAHALIRAFQYVKHGLH